MLRKKLQFTMVYSADTLGFWVKQSIRLEVIVLSNVRSMCIATHSRNEKKISYLNTHELVIYAGSRT